MKKYFVLIIIFFLSSFYYLYYLSSSSTISKKLFQTIQIVCTTGMISDTVQQIGGPWVTVTGLMGAGVDPHLYRARERDMQILDSADIIFYNGLHLEGKMNDFFLKLRARKPTIAVTDRLDRTQLIRSEFDGIYDPHIWHDLQLWMNVIDYIAESLIKFDPVHKEHYQENAQKYKMQLDELDRYIRRKIGLIQPSQRILITAHDAFSYFGRAYGFTVEGLQGISTDAEISAKDITQLVSLIMQHNIKAIFLESSLPHRNIKAVQQAVKAKGKDINIGPELYSDSLGAAGQSVGSYLGMIRHNIDTIVAALQ